jgi:hypothetical protein
MSISDEIIRIKNNIANAYDECEEKGATLPTIKNSANLSSTINTIQGGGLAKKYNITVDNFLGDIDDEGNISTPVSGDLIATGVVTADDYVLSCKFGGSAWGTSRPQGCKTIEFPDLKYIGNAGLAYFYTYSTDLETVSFPALEEIGQCGMNYGFQWNSNLKSISFPKLKTLSGMYSSLANVCYWCQKLESVNLDSLESINSNGLQSAFCNCSKLKTLSFPALTTESFNNNTNQFDSMLSGVSNCTVHFPFKIKDCISEWKSVLAGFGGTNTTIVFDLHTATLNFISEEENLKISINNRVISGTSGYAEPGDATYSCYNCATNTILLGSLSDLKEDTSVDVNLNFNRSSSKIKIATGVSGLDVTFKINGLTLPSVEESSGNYVINVIGSDAQIQYFIDGGDNYSDIEGTAEFIGENITISATLTTPTWVSFTQPNLTSNGVLGGDSFAVSGTGQVSTSYDAYKAFDGNSGTYWWASNSNNNTLTFYNPKKIKVSQIAMTNYSNSSTYLPSEVIVQGSNDNQTWEDLYTGGYETDLVRTMDINSSKAYFYYRIKMTVCSIYIRITKVEITGKCKE